jgi:phytoene synthase
MTSDDPERGLILAYAPVSGRAALAALLMLDDALAALLRTTKEPAIGQIRLAWWREALERLDSAPPPAEPVLQAIVASGLNGSALTPIVDGWEVLIEAEALDADALRRFGEGRGMLFTLAGAAMGAVGDSLSEAGQGWALADLARHLGPEDEAAQARAMARSLLDVAAKAQWSRNGRALGAMTHLARRDLANESETAPMSRISRLLWHRLTGR